MQAQYFDVKAFGSATVREGAEVAPVRPLRTVVADLERAVADLRESVHFLRKSAAHLRAAGVDLHQWSQRFGTLRGLVVIP